MDFYIDSYKKKRKCVTCNKDYTIENSVGTLTCNYHKGTKLVHENVYTCCYNDLKSIGCIKVDHHESTHDLDKYKEFIIYFPLLKRLNLAFFKSKRSKYMKIFKFDKNGKETENSIEIDESKSFIVIDLIKN